MRYIGLIEAAENMYDGIDFPNIRKKLVAEALALRGALHQARDIHELDRRGHAGLRLRELEDSIESRVGDFDHTDVRFDRTKRVILRRSRLRGKSVKE
jgi:hypothetical protein